MVSHIEVRFSKPDYFSVCKGVKPVNIAVQLRYLRRKKLIVATYAKINKFFCNLYEMEKQETILTAIPIILINQPKKAWP